MASATSSSPLPSTRPRARAGPALHLLYVISGATALLYEIAWTRLLSLELGHTTAAASAVLAAFMGGLALGAFGGASWARRLPRERALFAYAGIEVAIAALALLLPLELKAVHPVLAVAYGNGPGSALFHAVRFVSAVLIVGVPATLMGATYPLIIQTTGDEARSAATLYASNTAGAAVGALAAGFVCLPVLGLWKSTLVGVAGNLVVAAIAWRLGRTRVGFHHQPATRTGKKRSRPSLFRLALLATTVAGCAALSLELAWTRTLATVLGPTTYAFSTTVACFIVGIAVGSAGASRLLRARRVQAAPEGWLALILAAAALLTAWGVSGVDDAVLAIAERTTEPGLTYARFLAAQFLDAAVLVIPAAVAFGAAFPMSLAVARADSSREAGWLYGANTMGAIAGSIVSAMLVIPIAGLLGTFAAATVLLCATSLLLGLVAWRTAPVAILVSTAVIIGAGVILKNSGWNPRLLSSGAYKYSSYIGIQDLEARLAAGSLRYYREGAAATVAVRDLAGVRTLAIDGKVDASNGGDMLTQRLLAHVPLLLHAGRQSASGIRQPGTSALPSAGSVAIIGLGSGVTLGSALTHPVRQVDVIEISPEVVEAAKWFSAENRAALRDPRVRVIIGDARTHFRLAAIRYDVIVSEPSNPWMAGVAALFTREFFETLKDRLAPGGLVCQWAHTYDIASADLKSIVATFSSVFPHLTVWLVGDGDLLLVGGERPIPGELPRDGAAPAALSDLQSSRVTSAQLLDRLRLGDRAFALRWAGNVPLQSDDRMALEFSAPAATVGASREDIAGELAALAGYPSTKDPVILRELGLMLLSADAPRRAWSALWPVASRTPDDSTAVDALVKAAAMVDEPKRLSQVERLLRAFIEAQPAARGARVELARLLASTGRVDEARAILQPAAATQSNDAAVEKELAAIAADAGDVDGLRAALEGLRALEPDAAHTSYFEAVARMLGGQPAEATRLARVALSRDPRHAASWNLLGAALGASDAPVDEIRKAFQQAIHSDPSDPAAYVNLGTLELQAGRPEIAADWFAQALTLEPGSAPAREGLAAATRSR